MRPQSRSTLPKEAGFALIEVMVSGLIAVIVAAGVFTLLQSTTRSAADQRERSQSYAVAQEDQARLRALRVPALKSVSSTPRKVTLDGMTYDVVSSAKFVNNVTEDDATCGEGTTSQDYVRISSTVTWSNMGATPPTVIKSIIAPPRSAIDPERGTLAITVTGANGAPRNGVGLSGTGAGTFSGSTNSNGCAIFHDLPKGDYTLSLSGAITGLVDNNGQAATSKTVSVFGGSANTVALQYDQPGRAKVSFQAAGYSGTVSSKEGSITVFNSGMSSAKTFTATPASSITTTKTLFPFTSPYAIYAGSCADHNPDPDGTKPSAAIASVTVPANGEGTGTITLPSLLLTVKKGSSNLNGARVEVRDTKCSKALRTYTTEKIGSTSGRLADPGLPWSTYSVCAETDIQTTEWVYNSYRRRWEEVTVTKTYSETKTAKLESLPGASVEISLTDEDEDDDCDL